LARGRLLRDNCALSALEHLDALPRNFLFRKGNIMRDTFSVLDTLRLGDKNYRFYSLAKFGQKHDIKRLPYSMKIVLENLLRFEDGLNITMKEVEAVANWDAKAEPDTEISFMPARVVLQDFTGVPCVVDLAAMRDAVTKLGGNPKKINPLDPVRPGHRSLGAGRQVRHQDALDENVEIEFERNGERYEFLRGASRRSATSSVVPPATGIVHQVNLEHLARVVMTKEERAKRSRSRTPRRHRQHTTMINGLGVLGWGVGGIEAEAVMLGQPIYMLIPRWSASSSPASCPRARPRPTWC
jgi:aconitate hydratase